MGFLRRLFGGAPAKEPEASVAPDARHSVAVWVRLFDPAFENDREQLATFALEDRLMAAMDAAAPAPSTRTTWSAVPSGCTSRDRMPTP